MSGFASFYRVSTGLNSVFLEFVEKVLLGFDVITEFFFMGDVRTVAIVGRSRVSRRQSFVSLAVSSPRNANQVAG